MRTYVYVSDPMRTYVYVSDPMRTYVYESDSSPHESLCLYECLLTPWEPMFMRVIAHPMRAYVMWVPAHPVRAYVYMNDSSAHESICLHEWQLTPWEPMFTWVTAHPMRAYVYVSACLPHESLKLDACILPLTAGLGGAPGRSGNVR